MKKIVTAFLFIFILVALGACSQKAKVTSSWADPSLKSYGANNILVFGISNNDTTQKLYENVFVDEFAKTNVQAMASFKTVGTIPDPDRKTVEAAIKSTGASAVLITHAIDSTSKTQTYPGTIHFLPGGYYGSMYGYYGHTYQAVYTPPTSVTRTTLMLETNLYDVATEKLVWSVQSEAIDPKLLRTDFERIVNIQISDMKKNGVIP